MIVPHLLFEQEGASGRQGRRLLIIAPAFPPSIGAGAVRLEKIAQHAAWRGWQVDAITGPYDSPDQRDDSRLHALPPGVRVWLVPMPHARTPKWITASYRRIRSLVTRQRVEGGNAPSTLPQTQLDRDRAGLAHQLRIRRHFARWRRWTEVTVQLGMRLTGEHRPSIIFSSGPPHEAHEAARLALSFAWSAARCRLPGPLGLTRRPDRCWLWWTIVAATNHDARVSTLQGRETRRAQHALGYANPTRPLPRAGRQIHHCHEWRRSRIEGDGRGA